LIRILIIKFIIPRWNPWELVMYIFKKENCTANKQQKYVNKSRTQVLKYSKYNTITKVVHKY